MEDWIAQHWLRQRSWYESNLFINIPKPRGAMRNDHFISPRQDEMISFMTPMGFDIVAYMKYEEACEKKGKRFVQFLWTASLLIHINILSTKLSLYAGSVKIAFLPRYMCLIW